MKYGDYSTAPITLSALDTHHFRVGMRIVIGLRPRWHVRTWRWLTKSNLRVAAIDHDSQSITLERCR